eukprot:TRINITY_DN28209_c0_g1_i1.p1 TRINITY_DN28209_c0_g1~~TRINITY_DN28209_c0_g1_i1.p1  ORF type:complete len:177 (-),score=44.75 TRINITY_DN28209_c0_g1_i1:288-818(-)
MSIFRQIDTDKSGSITIGEFEKHFNDREVRGLFASLEIDAADAWTLFRALDVDGDNEVFAEEFLEGCMFMRGAAKSIDLASFRRDVKKRNLDLISEVQAVKAQAEKLERIQKRIGKLWQTLLVQGHSWQGGSHGAAKGVADDAEHADVLKDMLAKLDVAASAQDGGEDNDDCNVIV